MIEDIEGFEKEIQKINQDLKQIPKHITWEELKGQDKIVNSSDARSLLQDLFLTEADILPEPENKRIRIRVHNASTPAANRSIMKLLTELNLNEMEYPATGLKLYYELCSPPSKSDTLVSTQLHRNQEA